MSEGVKVATDWCEAGFNVHEQQRHDRHNASDGNA